MLVLARKCQQQIQIGENITITVLRVKGNSVRLGIDAPSQIRVTRGELEVLAAEDSVATKGSSSHRRTTGPPQSDERLDKRAPKDPPSRSHKTRPQAELPGMREVRQAMNDTCRG